MESMFKSYSNAKLSKAWVQRPSGLIKWRKVQVHKLRETGEVASGY